MNDGKEPVDMTDDLEYQKFVESMVQYCHCAERHRPCDGVLAGGLCDNIQEDDCDVYMEGGEP